METAQDALLNLMGVVNICGCVLWVWPWYLMVIRKSWSLCCMQAGQGVPKLTISRNIVASIHCLSACDLHAMQF